MSNALAVPAVTAAITTLVQGAVDELGLNPRPIVGPRPLDETGDTARVGVHLYRLSRNGARSTADLPTRSATGQVRARPRVALDLHYLVSFRAPNEWESQQVMAQTAAALHRAPIVTSALLAAAALDHPEIAANDLGDADEPVRIVAEPIGLDDLTRIWAIFTPGAFALTLAVTAGPVLVDGSGEPGAVVPVRQVLAGVEPFDLPRLDAVGGPDGPGAPIRAAAPMSDLELFGAGLSPRPGETVEVLLGDAVLPVEVVDDGRLRVAAPPVGPGVVPVSVRRSTPAPAGSPSSTPRRLVSNVVAADVRPTLAAVTATVAPVAGEPGRRSGQVRVTLVPAVTAANRIRVLLDSVGVTPAFAVAADVDRGAVAGSVTQVDVDLERVPAGTYRVTVEVDGARSLPVQSATGTWVATTVTL